MKTGTELISNDELILSGNVIDDSWLGWMRDEDVCFSPLMVRNALAQLGEGRITVRINSVGGHVNAGEQIRSMLAGHPGGCRIIVEGLAASAASLILMAGSERLMSAGSHIMIHDPSGAIWGTADEGKRHLEGLEVTAETYATVYAAASGKTPEEARRIMKAETWYGPEAAMREGFADAVAAEAASPAATATLETARAAYMGGAQMLRSRIEVGARQSMDRAGRPAHSPAAARGNQQKEAIMANETPADAPPANPPVVSDPATMQVSGAVPRGLPPCSSPAKPISLRVSVPGLAPSAIWLRLS
ncbi:head maturation protease, ClpP-related [Paracoccus sp. (in: a-proteobacteria)]|uniref:head maturation protease, ClpP-related n=1 Tax=Paracoccus sp. TaxID=267 RepID=UPI0028AA0F03|nr:head maturation protease, ClpP-related [Paracoccus sp. (in: a-proteobacteria)]